MNVSLPAFIQLAYIDPSTGFTITTLGGWFLAYLLGCLGLVPVFFKKFRRFLRRWWWIFVLAAVASAMIYGVMVFLKSKAVGRASMEGRIIVLGFDGLDPDLMEPLMAEGRLPHFENLRKNGSYSRLRTTNPPQSPVAWSAFQTGQNPGKNGVFDFIVRNPETYELRLSLSNFEGGKPRRVVRSKSFWQYLSERKIPSVILGCPITFPPDAVRGRMLSGMGVPDVLGTEGTFSYYTDAAVKGGRDVGGNVFVVHPTDPIVANLVGPKVGAAGKAENVKVPMKIRVHAARHTATVEFQGRRTELAERHWSDWQEVSFRLGWMRRMKGIFRFYLVETEPHLRLYASPINFDPRDPYFPISHPGGYAKKLVEKIGLYYTAGMPMDTWALNEGRLDERAFIDQVNLVFEEKNRMLDYELERFREGLLFFYLECPDIVQHMFWRFTDPGNPMHDAAAPAEYRAVIRDWYRKIDGVLGKVIARLDSRDTLVVLSDHGMKTFRRAVHLNAWLRQNGWLELMDPRVAEGRELLSDVDWTRTRAYAIGFGAVYLNLSGREKGGIVPPGEGAEALKREISEKLAGWSDPDTGSRVVKNVYRREEIFWGDHAAGAPDIYVGFNAGYRASWQTAIGGVPEALIEDNAKKWAGDHLFDPDVVPGVLFSNRAITKGGPSLYDVAPTVLKLAGFGGDEIAACGFDGSPLFE